MSLPFSADQFMSVFAHYNNSIWPLQILLNVLGVLAVILCLRAKVLSILVSTILAGLWLWMGLVYHYLFFTAINPGAYLFAGAFVLQGALFFFSGAIRRDIAFGFEPGLRGYAGAVLIAYGLLFYPVLGYYLGHQFPSSPTFGVPCPTTIFTFGLLLWTRSRFPWHLLIIPILWSLVGFTAAIQLGILEDVGLLISGIAGTTLFMLWKPVGATAAAA